MSTSADANQQEHPSRRPLLVIGQGVILTTVLSLASAGIVARSNIGNVSRQLQQSREVQIASIIQEYSKILVDRPEQSWLAFQSFDGLEKFLDPAVMETLRGLQDAYRDPRNPIVHNQRTASVRSMLDAFSSDRPTRLNSIPRMLDQMQVDRIADNIALMHEEILNIDAQKSDFYIHGVINCLTVLTYIPGDILRDNSQEYGRINDSLSELLESIDRINSHRRSNSIASLLSRIRQKTR